MITRISIKNFKSLADFSMPLGQFTCLIGLNGAGKTTVLQAMDFIGRLACGETDFRGWARKDIITKGSNLKTLTFQVDFLLDNKEKVVWYGKYNIDMQRFSEEQIYFVIDDPESYLPFDKFTPPYNHASYAHYLFLKENTLSYIAGDAVEKDDKRMLSENHITLSSKDISLFKYTGSALSAFKFSNPVILAVQKELQKLKSLELLSPDILRHVSHKNDSMGLSGEGLPGFLSSMSEADAKDLVATLNDFYPDFKKYEIQHKKFGWKDLLIKEVYFKSPIAVAHINDGFLRVLAMLSQKYSKASFLLFDEIENGINQEVIEKLLKELQNFNGKQVLATTHSALVLNYLTDDIAKESVIFLYKNLAGYTQARKFFDIEEMKEKLMYLGPGEVMSDTNLESLSRTLAQEGKKGSE